MKIKRSNYIEIATSTYKLNEVPSKRIDYDKWTKFIESHKDYFIWYEDTPNGIDAKENIDKVPEGFKDRVIHSLNKVSAYSTNKIVKRSYDFIVTYRTESGTISISIEKSMTKEIAEILLKMAKFLDGKVIVSGTEILEDIEQLE